MGLNAQSETLRAQIDTGAIRYDLGQRTAVTQLQTASLQDVNKQRTTLAGQVQSDAHRGGGGNAEINEAVANLRSIGDSIEKIPQRLLRAIADTAAQARRASAHSEENLRLINTNRDH